MTESLVQLELGEEEEERRINGDPVLHETSPAAFLQMGLDIEESQ